MKIRAIITGATGMVGRGVLLTCLEHEEVEAVLVINRTSVGLSHLKLKEVIHKDFFDLSSIQHEFEGYNACFFCLGVSSFRMSEANYTRLTYDLTIKFARTLLEINAEMTFCYVSGTGTDSTERGKSMWARVKGKTENEVLSMGFKKAYAFRPGYIKPEKDTPTNTLVYKITMPVLRVLYPIIKTLFPKYTTTTSAIGLAMINGTIKDQDKRHIESVDINSLAGIKL